MCAASAVLKGGVTNRSRNLCATYELMEWFHIIRCQGEFIPQIGIVSSLEIASATRSKIAVLR
jgi:hypothetical protein